MTKIICWSLVVVIFLSWKLSTVVAANECGEKFQNLSAPVCTKAKYVLISGSLLTLGLYLSKRDTVYKIRQNSLRKKHLDRYSKVGEVIGWGYLNAFYVFGSFAHGLKFQDQESVNNAEYMTTVSGYTLLTTLVLKELTREPRPGFPDEYDSFPSGHASMAFAFASAVTARHGWYWGGVAHLIAFFISYSRVQDDRHYFHDLVAGATIGMSYAWGIHENYTEHKKPYWLNLQPSNDGTGLMVNFTSPFN